MTDESGIIREWIYDGRKCKVVQQRQGHFCGYAKTPLNFHYDDVSDVYDSGIYNLLEAHGGFTYGVDDDGWVGFDCGHAGDVCVIDPEERDAREYQTIWTPRDVMDEVESIADQLTLIESFVQTVTSKPEVSENDDA